MKITIKNKKEIEKMRKSGKITAKVLDMIQKYITPNRSTEELNDICHNYIIKKKAIPACLKYQNFPKSICISINDVVCHGIPNKKEKLKNGDLVNIDVAVIKDGFYTDASRMYIVGKTEKKYKKLCKITLNSLYAAISIIKPGLKIYKIGEIIQKYVENTGFSIVKEYCGHGIGKKFHELPQIIHYKNYENKTELKEGMTFTIEPMINEMQSDVKILQDGWTVKTKDGGFSAQYEHTILVTKNNCEILTLQKKENIENILQKKIYKKL